MSRLALRWDLALLLLAGCAATRGDPWQRGDEIFRDGDLVGLVDARRSAKELDLRWCGVRSLGERRLTSVRMVVFSDENGDLAPQPEEQLAVWNTRSATPVEQFSVDAAFRSTNVPADVLAHLCVLTEIGVDGLAEPLRQSRKLP